MTGNQRRIVIIGGTACGPKTAARARRCDPDAHITLVERRANLSSATCGLPYYVEGTIPRQSALVTVGLDHFRDVLDIDVRVNTEATAIDRANRSVAITDLKTKQTDTLYYDKLVLTTGAKPMVFDWPGRDLKGIFTLSGIPDARAIKNLLKNAAVEDVVIVGAGLIGLEMAEAFVAQGRRVTVIEAMDRVLPGLLDFDMGMHLQRHLEENGVTVLPSHPAKGFLGDDKGSVRAVQAGDRELPAQLVLLALGVRPDVSLAEAAGLELGARKGLKVDEYMRTSDPDIYAGGDCVEVKNLITGAMTLVPLGSTANKHGRIIGTNLAGGEDTFPGITGTGIAKVFELNAGRVGLNDAQAKDAGYEPVTAIIPGDEHASYYPGGRHFLLKVVADRTGGRVLGVQAVGDGDIAKRIDVLATAITAGLDVEAVANLDLAYAPPFNSAMDPIHDAANVIRNKISGRARGLSPAEVKAKLDGTDDFILLDVRSRPEWEELRIPDDRLVLIPIEELRRRAGELPKDSEIIAYCHTSIRAYSAQCILDGLGFRDVKFLDGSWAAWPYELDREPRRAPG
jgi:NADPH-dependent 2,4-dienoyl-CoA reductase/sulfur reductase-like enzyme/rhodanese-related sulfurtransferase